MLHPVTVETTETLATRVGRKKVQLKMWDPVTIVVEDAKRIPCEVVEVYNDRRVKVRELEAEKLNDKNGVQKWKLKSKTDAPAHFITRRKVGEWMLKNTNRPAKIGILDPYGL